MLLCTVTANCKKMGYLLKEALKTLCGVNQWSYAVFWKFGCQNPKLLIWEDCYYELASCSGLPGNETSQTNMLDYDSSWVSVETRNSRSSVQAGEKVHFLVNKMMMENHINIVGEGLVGRAAFTGNHQWILSDNYFGEARPPEVLKEVCQQFSAGMQTVAVIPVLPHGVVQFGSNKTIMENMGFVNDVTSLVLQLGHVPGVLLSENYATKELDRESGIPVCHENSTPGGSFLESNVISASSMFENFNFVGSSAQSYVFDNPTSNSFAREIENNLQSDIAAFHSSNSSASHLRPSDFHQEVKKDSSAKLDFSPQSQLMNRVAKAEVIPSCSNLLMNQHASLCIPRSNQDFSSISSSTLDQETIRCSGPKSLLDNGNLTHFGNPSMSNGFLASTIRTNSGMIHSSNNVSVTRPSFEVNGLSKNFSGTMKPISSANSVLDKKGTTCSKMEDSKSDSIDLIMRNSLLGYSSGSKNSHMDKKLVQSEVGARENVMEQYTTRSHDIPISQHNDHLSMAAGAPSFAEDDTKQKYEVQMHSVSSAGYDDARVQPQWGDDLFDILGADFKSKIFNSSWNDCLSTESAPRMNDWDKNNFPSRNSLASSEIYSTSQVNSESGIFAMPNTDHLLDAVVSKIHPSSKQNLDDNVSCKTTLTNTSSSSAVNTSLPYGRFGVSEKMKEELFGVPKYTAKAGGTSSCSLRTGTSKEDSGTFSQGSSIYGSQISSWIGKGQNMKQSPSQSQSQSQSVSTGYSKKPDETGKTGRKRLKPGENPRPRPKDRQMIQDRVKELREIVPNGAKCSIDALLERTIKHMLFLQSVTKHADKLKQTGESKIIGKDGGLLLKDNFEGGATWAYEVGSQSMVCPIIVEDLNQPRQMLVEMMCEETGLFLEIADIIRGLGLTILKGFMETRNDKIWARFAVEANRDVTRMEIFLSLVRLLEQSAKTNASQINGTSGENMTCQQLQRAAFVPVTGSQ